MRTKSKKYLSSLAVGLAFACSSATAAETVTYSGTGTYVVTRSLLPLASGGAAIQQVNDVVATIEPSETGFIYGDCAGLGYLSPEEEFSVDVYCTFAENGEDRFDLKGHGSHGEGAVEIIGGSGKWTGATGTGTLKRRFAEGNRGTYEYEFKITTP